MSESASIEKADNGYIVRLSTTDLTGSNRYEVYQSLTEALYQVATWLDPKVVQVDLTDTRIAGTQTVNVITIESELK